MKCPICNSDQHQSLRAYRGQHELFHNRDLNQCDSCGFVFTCPLPSDDDLHAYNSMYFENAHGGFGTDPITLSFQAGINRVRARHFLKSIPSSTKLRTALEVGPGSGFLGRAVKEIWPEVDYRVVEADLSRHQDLKELGFECYESMDQIPQNFKADAIIASHVLEHVNDPLHFLRQMKQHATEAAFAFIEVPCMDWKFKEQEEPHLLFFDKKTLGMAFAKVGLKKSRFSYHGPSISEGYLRKKIRIKYGAFIVRVVRRLARAGFVVAGSGRKLSLLERLCISQFNPGRKRIFPSWWVRGVAQFSALEK